MTRFVAGHTLWTEIEKWATRTRGRKKVAVAFIGRGASAVLKLKAGDTLICAGSLRNARAGIINPDELLKLHRAGVRLFAHENLHAKIYLGGAEALIGSANLSRSSRQLDEAMVLVRDRREIRRIGEWFDAREDVEVSVRELRAWKKAYRPPKAPFHLDSDQNAGSNNETLWILSNIRYKEFSQLETRLATEAESAGSKRQRRGTTLDVVSWPTDSGVGRSIKQGDKAICMWRNGRVLKVSPVARCVAVRRGVRASGRGVTVIALEFPGDGVATVGYGTFLVYAKQQGVRIQNLKRTRAIRDTTAALALRKASALINDG